MKIQLPNDKITWCEWFASLCGIIGATLFACNLGFEAIGFMFFLASSLVFCYVFHRVKMRGALLLNVVFTFINVFGLWRWLIVLWL